jgi:hypothetical protein
VAVAAGTGGVLVGTADRGVDAHRPLDLPGGVRRGGRNGRSSTGSGGG